MCDFGGSYPSPLGANFLDDRMYVFTVRPRAKPSDPFLNVVGKLPNFGAKLPNFGAKLPNFGAKLPNFGMKLPNFGAKLPNFGAKLPNFGAKLPNFGVVFRRQIGGQRIVASGTVWIELQQAFIPEAPQH